MLSFLNYSKVCLGFIICVQQIYLKICFNLLKYFCSIAGIYQNYIDVQGEKNYSNTYMI